MKNKVSKSLGDHFAKSFHLTQLRLSVGPAEVQAENRQTHG